MSVTRLAELLSSKALRRLAGARFFERGEAYFAEERVRSLQEKDAKISATVHGTVNYRVALWVEDGGLTTSCSCPLGDDGECCKHCVAVGLAWLAGRQGQNKPGGTRSANITERDIREYLDAQSQATLVQWLLEQSGNDERLRRRLLLQVAAVKGTGIELAAYRKTIDLAVRTHGFIDYNAAHGYAQGIDEAIDAMEELLEQNHAAAVIELCEYALRKVEDAMEAVDDSDGGMSGLFDRLQGLHLAACYRAKPDPEALARRLFQWEIAGQWDIFFGAVQQYAEVLGAVGLAVYRQLAEAEWASIPPLTAGSKGVANHDGKRFRITHIMEAFAGQTGDIEVLVAVKSCDLSQAYHFLKIAEIYRNVDKHDKALHWAERGLHAFPTKTDTRLRDFLSAEYHRRKRHDEAMALVWAEFAEHSCLETYKKLKQHAAQIRQWSHWHGAGRLACCPGEPQAC